MGLPPSIASPGQRIQFPASLYNALVKLDQQAKLGALDRGPDGIGFRSSSSTLIRVQNETGVAIPRWQGGELTTPVFPPVSGTPPASFLDDVVMKFDYPSRAHVTGKMVILQEQLPYHGIGLAVVEGVTPCKINVLNENHRYCDLRAGESMPATRGHGQAKVLWKDSGTGEKWAVIQLHADYAHPPTFAVNVYRDGGADGTASTAATYTYTVKDLDDVVLGTSVSLARRRPNGSVSPASSGAYGLAFYDADNLKLWDVDEIPNDAVCPSGGT